MVNPVRLRLISSFVFTSASLALATVHAEPADSPVPTTRIAHAENVKTCGFAPVIVGPKNCTATLVHPKVVICAAHCVAPIRSVLFGESTSRPGKRAEVEYCKKHPDHPSSEGTDWSFCVLKEPVTDIPVIPPAFGCELDEFMKVGQKVTQVGYGANAGKHGQSTGTGIKRWAENIITEMEFSHKDNIKVGPNSKNIVACPGDSGGPLLVRVKDGSWRSIAIASRYSGNCGAENPFNIYARIGKAVAWIEKESKIDITPCFDSDGTWNPTKDCTGFYSGDSSVQGSWSNSCEEAPKSGYSSTCGKAFGESEDPKISVSSPEDGTEIEAKELPASVTIKAELDGDRPDTFTIGLVVDGKELEKTGKTEPPWEWNQELKAGKHEIAVWFDIGKQKRQQSETVELTVVEAAQGSPDPSEQTPKSEDPSSDKSSQEDSSKDKSEGTNSKEATPSSDTEKNSGETKSDDPTQDPTDDAPAHHAPKGCRSGQPLERGWATIVLVGLFGLHLRRSKKAQHRPS